MTTSNVVNTYLNLKPCLISNYNTDQRKLLCESPHSDSVGLHSAILLYRDLKQMTFPDVRGFKGLPVHCPFQVCE